MKIAVVDDGLDQTNPFFDPAGFSYPAGFPKGDTSATTPKVIVARVFPGPNAGKAGRLPIDPNSSFHGTHVAGIAAGDSGTTAPAGADHPRVTGLERRRAAGLARQLPRLHGADADRARREHAGDRAGVRGGCRGRDGRDQLLRRRAADRPARATRSSEAVHNVAAAGVVPVIAAGNDRDEFGAGSVGSPGTAPDAISVAAVSNAHVFAPALDVVAAGAPATLKGHPVPRRRRQRRRRRSGAAPTRRSWTSARWPAPTASRSSGTSAAPAGDLASAKGTLPAHSLDGADRARAARASAPSRRRRHRCGRPVPPG